MIRLELPWPANELSPNWRGHWSTKSRKVKQARFDAKVLCLATNSLLLGMVRQGGKLKVHLTFRPNDRRRRDVDNLIAMHKGALDGIADALGIDDSQFRLSAEIGGISKPPCVVVEIS